MPRSISKQSVWGIHVGSPEEEQEGYGGKDLQKSKVLSPEWRSEGWRNTNNNKLLVTTTNAAKTA